MASKENPLNRRMRLLEREWERRAASLDRKMFEPEPPFQVKMSEQDAFRRALVHEQDGYFLNARESNGGHIPDADMDRYASWFQRKKAEFLPHLLLRDVANNSPEYAGVIERVRLAKQRFDDPNDNPEEWDDTSGADEGFDV